MVTLASILLIFPFYLLQESLMTSKSALRGLSLVLFILGLLIGSLFYGLVTWANFEASLFAEDVSADTRLSSLKCPLFLSPNQTGTASASFYNSTDQPIQPMIVTNITNGLVLARSEDRQQPTIPAGQALTLSWKLTPDMAAWGRFILVRVTSTPYLLPSQTGACGVTITHFLGLPGNVLIALEMGLGLILTVSGLALWVSTNRPMLKTRQRNITSALAFLLILMLLGMVSVFVGVWWIGMFCFILSVLALVVSWGYAINSA
jgi:hypothetical protein